MLWWQGSEELQKMLKILGVLGLFKVAEEQKGQEPPHAVLANMITKTRWGTIRNQEHTS